jgi:hypothetical protein
LIDLPVSSLREVVEVKAVVVQRQADRPMWVYHWMGWDHRVMPMDLLAACLLVVPEVKGSPLVEEVQNQQLMALKLEDQKQGVAMNQQGVMKYLHPRLQTWDPRLQKPTDPIPKPCFQYDFQIISTLFQICLWWRCWYRHNYSYNT